MGTDELSGQLDKNPGGYLRWTSAQVLTGARAREGLREEGQKERLHERVTKVVFHVL